jgi:tRNA U55 pseudouridine synthase TruB
VGRPLNGWLVIDKPSGMTSTQVVGRAKRLFDAQKVGHGGTLDPLATGLLPLAFGTGHQNRALCYGRHQGLPVYPAYGRSARQ